MKTLIIAEKPSVALDISRALGGFTREKDFFESEEFVLSSSVGHLLTLVNPDDVKRGKWSFANLPAIPHKAFDLAPIDKRSKDRLSLLLKLIKRKDVDCIINACDAGREGELIFKYIIQYSKTKKPVRRLWLQSMTKGAIVEAFSNLRDDQQMKSLEAAARSRAEADWLIGINGTRAMTAFNSKEGGFFKTPIGRVQTPTLKIVFDRSEEIARFKPVDYWEVHATFSVQAGSYEARYIQVPFKKDPNQPESREYRLWSESLAKMVMMSAQGQEWTVEDTSKPSNQYSALLFDLTSLQREANARFGFSAKVTLSLAQALYEKHKLLTYPRTDSRYLPEDYIGVVKNVLTHLVESPSAFNRGHIPFAQEILNNSWVKPSKRIFDGKKVSDHFAIIPTFEAPKNLNEAEAKIYDLVVKRFLAVFYPPAQYEVTTRLTSNGVATFKTEGKVLKEAGWLVVYGRQDANKETLVPIQLGEKAIQESLSMEAFQTKPPVPYTEATLLSAMEGAGKLVSDDAFKEAMSERGLGTPATRATIIEGLINEGYLRREVRDLQPTAKARQLMTLLSGLEVKELTSPELTGEWEYALRQIEQGHVNRDQFMNEIVQSTERIVERAKKYEHNSVPGDYMTLQAVCPICGSTVKENYRAYACQSCEFRISKHPGGRTFEPAEVEQLINEGTLGPLTGFISKMGRPFSAILKLNEEYKLEFDFGQQTEKEEINFSELPAMGQCPKCQHTLYEAPMSYLCEKTADKICDFKVGRVILSQTIEPEQFKKLIETGKTDLLEQFVSNRSGRKFSAYLVLDKNGKVGFEFEKKVAKPRGKKTTKKA